MHGSLFLLFYRRGGRFNEVETTDAAARALCMKRVSSYTPGMTKAGSYCAGIARAGTYQPGVLRAEGC